MEEPPPKPWIPRRIQDTRIYTILSYTPQRCRYDPSQPPRFSLPLNLLFSFAATFTVANLYYNHPILNVLSLTFSVTYEQISLVPTLMQAGYAAGLLFLCPLGDIFKRRAMVLWLIGATATMWIGLCVTESYGTFCALSFLTAMTTVTPQLMLPLVGDLAPPHRRATALSIVVSGLLLGLLIARVLSGVVTQFTDWRNIYWLSLGLQYLILILLWFFMPDYPSTNPGGLNYFKMLWSIGTIAASEPVLVQACLVGFFTSATFTSYWTTLTFLLASPPYGYDNLVIGLFAFIGIGAMCFGPPYSRLVIDKFAPLFSVILGELICITGIAIGTYIGTYTVAGPVIQAFAIDLGLQTSQIANRSAIYGVAPKARNRVNTAYMVSVFCGQLMGTAVGNHFYADGGWVRSGSVSVGFIGAALCICFARGPWEKGWVGWRGGWGLRRRDLKKKGDEEKEARDGESEEEVVARETMEREMVGEEKLGGYNGKELGDGGEADKI
jgi:predicted MFS family arabinose efflux permease